jgi:hypothetical protein
MWGEGVDSEGELHEVWNIMARGIAAMVLWEYGFSPSCMSAEALHPSPRMI